MGGEPGAEGGAALEVEPREEAGLPPILALAPGPAGRGRGAEASGSKDVWIVADFCQEAGQVVDESDGEITRVGGRGLLRMRGNRVLALRRGPPADAALLLEAWRQQLPQREGDATPVGPPPRGGGLAALRASLRGEAAAEGGAEEDEVDDFRILPIARDAVTKERYREWRTVAARATEKEFDDWVLEGPRTALWMGRQLSREGGGPLAHHQRWKAALKLDEHDRAGHEHEHLATMWELAGSYDQLSIGSLACVEVLARRMQLLEEAKGGSGAAAYEGARHFLGWRRPGALVAPALSRFVAERMKEETAILKEKRKADEAKTAKPGSKKKDDKGECGAGVPGSEAALLAR